MVKEYKNLMMEIDMKDNIETINLMDKASSSMPMVMFLKVIGLMERLMALENLSRPMVKNTLEIGKMTYIMVKENYNNLPNN